MRRVTDTSTSPPKNKILVTEKNPIPQVPNNMPIESKKDFQKEVLCQQPQLQHINLRLKK